MTRLFSFALILSAVAGAQTPEVLASYAKSNHFADGLMYTDLSKMLDAVKPEAVATFTDTYSHLKVVEACAPRHIPVMMEKPLAVDMKQARAIQQASERYNTPVLVNYETTWYRSHGEIWSLFHDQKAAGEIRKMVAMDGHQGPKEINVPPEFFALRFRLLRRQSDDVADGQSAAPESDGADADREARNLRPRG